MMVLFHVNNMFMFSIGNFPYFMIPATTILLWPDWPLRLFNRLRGKINSAEKTSLPLIPKRSTVIRFVVLSYMCFHLIFPFRHLLFTGRAAWTEEGHEFAWRMMLRSKASFGVFIVKDLQSGREIVVEPSKHLPGPYWERSMCESPELILQFAHHLRDYYRQKGIPEVAVYSQIKSSLNFRRYQYIVNPTVDLAKEKRQPFKHYNWIMPLTEELP